MSVELRGFDDFEKALRALPKATGKNTLRRIAKKSMEPMAELARGYAPVAEGDLKASIKVSERRTKRASTRENRFDKNTGIQMAMGPVSGNGVLNYATYVEFGTAEAAAKPFMRPAWRGGREAMLEDVKTNMWIEIDKSTARYAKKLAKAE
jgi:HK97 gp10 family phage protein